MRPKGVCAAVAVVAIALAAGRSRAVPGAEPPAAEAEVRDLEAQWAQAVIRSDRAFFERVLAADFTHTSHTGVFKTRAEWLAEGRSADPQAGQTHYDGYDVDELAIRVHGDTAVVTGRTTPRGVNAKGQAMTGQYRFLRVWVKRQGRWQAVAFQGTRIAQPSPP